MGTETKSAGRPAGRAQTLRMQGLVNALTRTALSTPGVAKGIGRYLILLYVVGRKSGKKYTVPIAYIEHDGKVLIGTQFGWSRNLRTGQDLRVRYKGKLRTAEVEVVEDEDRVIELYRLLCKANHNFAGFHNIAIDAAGEPDPVGLRDAYKLGAKAILLTPKPGDGEVEAGGAAGAEAGAEAAADDAVDGEAVAGEAGTAEAATGEAGTAGAATGETETADAATDDAEPADAVDAATVDAEVVDAEVAETAESTEAVTGKEKEQAPEAGEGKS
ncbi:MAG: nitroreductase family deazaflavin-dependent oxidoreductase [Catenulispora sp.]|nr:nitroreductase family deazaflavin-dependent oxidoreductase [Catenulispora sp.]